MPFFHIEPYDWWPDDNPTPKPKTSVSDYTDDVSEWKVMPSPTPAFITSKDALIARIKQFVAFQKGDTSVASYRAVFDHYATDGSLDKPALARVLTEAYATAPSLFGGADRTVKDVLAAMDKNGDGKLDWDEFASGVHLPLAQT